MRPALEDHGPGLVGRSAETHPSLRSRPSKDVLHVLCELQARSAAFNGVKRLRNGSSHQVKVSIPMTLSPPTSSERVPTRRVAMASIHLCDSHGRH